MEFHYKNLETCHTAIGAVVVIDVIRAFTNAAVAFSRGAKEIYPVSRVDEALDFKAQVPNSLACGEVGGIAPEGFDFGNSPTETSALDLTGRVIVQRTGSGTQGIVRSVHASSIFAASLCVAKPTVAHIRKLAPEAVTFVITGETGIAAGAEDLACAQYLEALLKGQRPNPAPYIERVYRSRDRLLDPIFLSPAFPKSDLDHCANVDRFDFVMNVTKENGRHVMRAIKP